MKEINSVIEFHQVCRRFRKAWALRHASFRVPKGSITALLGPSGAGKSTAIKIALNLLRASTGKAEILGMDSKKLGPAQYARIGYVADGMELPEWMTVDQFLNWCRPLYPQWDIQLEQRLRSQFAIPGDRKLKHLSRGQRMKAALIAALTYRPELLVLDEPFSGLDPVVRDEFISGLLELADGEGLTVLISSHDIEEVSRLADHVILLNHGSVLLDEDRENLLARHRRIEVLLSENYGEIGKLPHHWIGAKSSGRILRFTDTLYDEGKFSALYQKHFPSCSPPEIHPLTLRELFVTLVQSGKADAGV
jgi:ABC-2 type transport system ATP-binding protein